MQQEKLKPQSDGRIENEILVSRTVRQIPAITGILRILSQHTGMRITAVARVTTDDWYTLAVHNELGYGLSVGDHLDVDTTLCKVARGENAIITVNDRLTDPNFIPAPLPFKNFRSFAAAPIYLANGGFFGTLCSYDPAPTQVEEPRFVGMFAAYAALIGDLLDSELDATRVRDSLGREQRVGAAREQFLAVVAHDLRNPLASVSAISELLGYHADCNARSLGKRLQAVSARMAGMINDLTDHARGQAGSAIPVSFKQETDLAGAFEAVIQEIRDAHPLREIRTDLHYDAVDCDTGRLQQLLSNLLANAIAYGSPSAPMVVEGFSSASKANLVVTNWGRPISAEKLSTLFDPYRRGDEDEVGFHMGLGLYICQQIAKAHGGVITVASSEQNGTRFEFRWPHEAV